MRTEKPTDRRTYTTRLIVAYCSFAKGVKNKFSEQLLIRRQLWKVRKTTSLAIALPYADKWKEGQTYTHKEANSLFSWLVNAPKNKCYGLTAYSQGRLRLKCDDTRAETRFLLSPKRTSPFKSAGASVLSTAGSQVVPISGSNAGCIIFRGSVRVLATHSIRQFPLHFPSSASPCAIRFQTHSTTVAANKLKVCRVFIGSTIWITAIHCVGEKLLYKAAVRSTYSKHCALKC